MANGDSMMNKIEFEKEIDGMSTTGLLRYLAIMMYDHCELHKELENTVSENKKRSYRNFIYILLLVSILTALGIIDVTTVKIF